MQNTCLCTSIIFRVLPRTLVKTLLLSMTIRLISEFDVIECHDNRVDVNHGGAAPDAFPRKIDSLTVLPLSSEQGVWAPPCSVQVLSSVPESLPAVTAIARLRLFPSSHACCRRIRKNILYTCGRLFREKGRFPPVWWFPARVFSQCVRDIAG